MGKKPDISKFSQKTPFEVPKDYFDKLPGIIQSRIGIEEEDEKSAVFDRLKVNKDHPFEVPKNYFRDLPSTIQERTTENKKGFSWSWNWETQRKWALVPAMLVVMITGYFVYQGQQTEQFDTDALIAQVSSEDLIAYLDATDISTEEIIGSVDFEGLDLEYSNEETDMLDELNFSGDDLDDIMLEFDLESGV